MDFAKKQELIEEAFNAAKRSYSPYSKFAVGAALLTKSGEVFCGANIENASFGGTICAERVAFAKAVYEGHREFEAIAVCGGKDGEVCPPCGICLQFAAEFCDGNFLVVLPDKDEKIKEITLGKLLPMAFNKKIFEDKNIR